MQNVTQQIAGHGLEVLVLKYFIIASHGNSPIVTAVDVSMTRDDMGAASKWRIASVRNSLPCLTNHPPPPHFPLCEELEGFLHVYLGSPLVLQLPLTVQKLCEGVCVLVHMVVFLCGPAINW